MTDKKKEITLSLTGDYEPDSWEVARTTVLSLTPMASSFTTCIRKLNSHQSAHSADGQAKLDPAARFMVERFLTSPTIKAHFYFFGMQHFEKELAVKKFIYNRDLIALFSPQELAAILGTIYMYHRLKKNCDKGEWKRLAKHTQAAVDIGTMLTRRVSGLEFFEGILIPSLRYLALALVLSKNIKDFQQYRRHLSQKKNGFDQKEELRIFGCSHVQLATLMLQELGFGVSYSQSFKEALSSPLKTAIPQPASRMRITALWQEALFWGTRPPACKGEDSYELSEDDYVDMSEKAELFAGGEGKYSWLLNDKTDIGPEQVPALHPSDDTEMAVEEEGLSVDFFDMRYDELPKEIRASFPRSEFSQAGLEIQGLLRKK